MFRLLVRFSFLVILMILGSASVLAQQIRGQVRYAESNQPAPRISIACDGTGGNLIQMTDTSGNFFFRVSPGQYTCSVHIPGYYDEQQSASLTDTNSNEYFFFKLRPNGKLVQPATVLDASVPEPARKEFEKGETALAGGKKENLEEATRHFEKAVALHPQFLLGELKLGTTYMDLQQWDKAEAALKKAIEIDPKAANPYLALGELYYQQKKSPEAEKALMDGLAIEDRSWQGHFTLARLYWDTASKNKDEAQSRPALEKSYEQVKKALELNPKSGPAHLLKGNLLMKVRRAPDALVEFEEYLKLEPKGAMSDQTKALVEKIKKALAETKP